MKKFLYFVAAALAIGGLAYFLKFKLGINPPLKTPLSTQHSALPLEKLELPKGFTISVFADSITGARSMCMSPGNTLFVGTKDEDKVYALRDEDGDKVADKKYIIYRGGNSPNGVAFKDGHLYVAEINRILRFKNIESHLENPGKPEVVYDKFPTEKHHGWKFIAFGPDGKLYVPVGAPCNICKSDDPYASLTRIDTNGKNLEVVQRGIRNTVGFTWHPDTKELWFTDNGRDMMGDDMPNCELNHAPKDFMHFGYPFCHEGSLPDPEFGKGQDCSKYTAPVAKMGAHTAPLGIRYIRNPQLPETYNEAFLIARHGSWNRTEKSGYDVQLVKTNASGQFISMQPFITGWLSKDKKEVWGRPVDIQLLLDGTILISDDYANCIYRVSYKQ